MDIEKAKKELKTRTEHFRQLLNSQIWVETDVEAVNVLLNELDKDNNIISDLQNEVTLKQCELDNKDKIINKLAFGLADYVMYYEYDKCRNPEMIKAKAKEQIDYFTKKVEDK